MINIRWLLSAIFSALLAPEIAAARTSDSGSPSGVELVWAAVGRVVGASEGGPELGVTVATWALVIITGILCWATWRAAKMALMDAGRLRQEVLRREVNTAAHRAAAMAERVGQLAANVPSTNARLRSFSAMSLQVPDTVAEAASARATRTEEIKVHALGLIIPDRENTDDELVSAQRRLDADLVNLEVMKEAILGEIQALDRQMDSAEREAALKREQQRLTDRRISSEFGQCNKLIFILGQMVMQLEDINDHMFSEPAKKLGRKPQWNEIGALVGAPFQAGQFILGEYTFLLEDDPQIKDAPEILARIYNHGENFRQVLARVDERSRLWQIYNDHRAGAGFLRGEDAMSKVGTSSNLTARLKELTAWIEEDMNQWIPSFKSLFPVLYRVLEERYPGRHFIRFWPKDSSNLTPL